MPQGILDERREKVDERVERWRDILGQEPSRPGSPRTPRG